MLQNVAYLVVFSVLMVPHRCLDRECLFFLDFRKERKGGEAEATGGERVKKEETEEEKQLRVSTMKLLFFKPTLY